MEQFISVKTMIQRFADWLVYGVFGMSAETHFGSAVNFFFYDSVKILILLFLISMVMGIVNAYFPIDKLQPTLRPANCTGFNTFLHRCSGLSRRFAPARRSRCLSVLSKAGFLWV